MIKAQFFRNGYIFINFLVFSKYILIKYLHGAFLNKMRNDDHSMIFLILFRY